MLALFNSSYRMIQILIYTLNVQIIGIGQPQGLPLRAIYLYWATTRVAPTGYLFVLGNHKGCPYGLSICRGNPCGCPFHSKIRALGVLR
jgi:hypothetical protein